MELTRVQFFAVIFFSCIVFIICYACICCKFKKYINKQKTEECLNKKYSDNDFIHNTYYTNLP
jgi:hypothetical protein